MSAFYWDDVWKLPTEGRFSDLHEEARYLGEMKAEQHNKEMSTGVIGSTEWRRIEYANERVEAISGVLGESAYHAFATGYDESIEFSLNADWRYDL